MIHVVVDGANVVGSRPDGWWRDRPAAARRLAAQLVAVLTTDPLPLAALGGGPENVPVVHLVLEGDARRAEVPTDPALHVVRAPADGDSAIVELATSLSPARVVVVTADQGLRRRVQRAGATVVGPRELRALLPEVRPVALPAEDDEPHSSTGEQ